MVKGETIRRGEEAVREGGWVGEERRREGRSDCGVGEDVEWRIRGGIDNERSEEWESRALRSPFEASEDEPNPTSHRRRRHEGADDRRVRSPMTSTPGPAQQVAKWRVAAAHHASCRSYFGVHCSLFPTVISSSPIIPDTQSVMRTLGQYQVKTSTSVYWNAPSKSRLFLRATAHHIHLPFLWPGTAFFTGDLSSPGVGYGLER